MTCKQAAEAAVKLGDSSPKRFWNSPACPTYAYSKSYELCPVDNNNITGQLAFAKSSSAHFPPPPRYMTLPATAAASPSKQWQRRPGVLPAETGLHGLFWMDQFDAARKNSNLSSTLPPLTKPGCTGKDCRYEHNFPQAVSEFIASFGEAVWDPQTRCAGPVPGYGSDYGGIWTYGVSHGLSSNIYSFGSDLTKSSLTFCFTDDSYTKIDIKVYNTPPGGFITTEVSSLFMSFTMVKLRSEPAIVWDRVTTTFGGLLTSEQHYPLYQVVDGDGKPTIYYESYLAWARSQSPKAIAGKMFEHGYSLTPLPFGQCPF